jgi:hypothetical protein
MYQFYHSRPPVQSRKAQRNLLRTTITEVIWKCGYTDAKIARHPIFTAPQIFQVDAVGDEGEARKPRCIEARS